jgi:hypothetical protein
VLTRFCCLAQNIQCTAFDRAAGQQLTFENSARSDQRELVAAGFYSVQLVDHCTQVLTTPRAVQADSYFAATLSVHRAVTTDLHVAIVLQHLHERRGAEYAAVLVCLHHQVAQAAIRAGLNSGAQHVLAGRLRAATGRQ